MSHAEPIRSEDAAAVEKLQARIAEAERRQDRMKRANAIIRGLQDPDRKVARLDAECGIREHIAQKLVVPDFAGRLGYPHFLLTNNAANIRRMRQRVQALSGENARNSVMVEFPGGRIEDCAEAGRIRIYHDAKPTKEVIRDLKLHGFHWSARLKCWSRLRNESARFYANVITGAHWPDAARALVRQADGESILPPRKEAVIAPERPRVSP